MGALCAPARADMPVRSALFGSHNLLSGLPTEYSSRLLTNAPTINLTKGKALFQIGAAGDGCYWLKEGVLKVSITSDQGAERILAILGPGSIVGELAMIDGLPRSASVQALRDSSSNACVSLRNCTPISWIH